MPAEIISFLIASIALTISPGPDIIYVLVQSMSTNKKDGIAVSLGLVSGIIVHTSLVAFGVSAIIKTNENLFLIIKVGGATYLLYLAFKLWSAKQEFNLSQKSNVSGFKKMFSRGFFMNVLNPKVTIFFLAFFPSFIWNPDKDLIFQFYALGLLFMLQAFIIFGIVAFLAEKITRFLNKNKQTQLFFTYVQIFVFIGIAILIFV
ncbi:LysE family translocator [Psychroflexus salis]|uniref:LysE family translocator n=1 Tax=Psychroflexus salis TaxID=1526574 RepID=A0A916ZQ34_9FLAO|nr:LysE family translocator [Psychroflexus salis]GGE07204.1 LysE family translocator [Psychroflexus salis]